MDNIVPITNSCASENQEDPLDQLFGKTHKRSLSGDPNPNACQNDDELPLFEGPAHIPNNHPSETTEVELSSQVESPERTSPTVDLIKMHAEMADEYEDEDEDEDSDEEVDDEFDIDEMERILMPGIPPLDLNSVEHENVTFFYKYQLVRGKRVWKTCDSFDEAFTKLKCAVGLYKINDFDIVEVQCQN